MNRIISLIWNDMVILEFSKYMYNCDLDILRTLFLSKAKLNTPNTLHNTL